MSDHVHLRQAAQVLRTRRIRIPMTLQHLAELMPINPELDDIEQEQQTLKATATLLTLPSDQTYASALIIRIHDLWTEIIQNDNTLPEQPHSITKDQLLRAVKITHPTLQDPIPLTTRLWQLIRYHTNR